MKTLSIRQPWATLIVEGHKDIENRRWSTKFRGPLLIHASLTVDPYFAQNRDHVHRYFGVDVGPRQGLLTGGLVGVVDLVDVVTTSSSRWFEGPYGWVLQHPRCLHFVPCQGRLGLFDLDYPGAVK